MKSKDLSNQQAECLFHLVKGMKICEIAIAMNLSPRTVEHYLNTVKEKLSCKTRSELIEKALRMPFIRHKLELL